MARASFVLLASLAYLTSVFQLSSDVFWTHGLGDWMDPYFINYLLEHWYKSLLALRDPASPPMFFPVPGTLGYSHGLVLYAPIYAAIRPFLHPFQAHALTIVIVIEAGLICLYLVFHRRCRLSFVESCLLTAFFVTSPNVVGAVLGVWSQRASIFLVPPILLMAWEAARMPPGRRRTILAGLAGLLATLLYTQDFYTAHFALLFVAFALAPVALAAAPAAMGRLGARWRKERPAVRAVLAVTALTTAWTLVIAVAGGFTLHLAGLRVRSSDWRRPALVAAAGLMALAWLRGGLAMPPRLDARRRWLLPCAAGACAGVVVFLWCYLGAYRELRDFPADEVMQFIAARDPSRWRSPLDLVRDLGAYESARAFQLVFLLGGLVWVPWFGVDRRTRLHAAWFLLISIVTLLVVVRFDGFSLWTSAFRSLPGFSAIRDPKRIIYHYELAAALAVAVLLSRLGRRSVLRVSSALLLLIALLAEPHRPPLGYVRTNAEFDRWVAAPVDVDGACRSFFIKAASPAYTARSPNLETLYAIDAMFVALDESIPTVNGYSGRRPVRWSLGDPHDPDYAGHVSDWIDQHRLAGVCELDIERRTMRPFAPAVEGP